MTDEELEGLRAAAKANTKIGIVMVPVQYFDGMMKAAERGDKQAQHCAIAFAGWSKKINTEAEIGRYPQCFNCHEVIVSVDDGGEGIGGIAVISPCDNDDHLQGTAFVAVFCPKCEPLGRDALMPPLRDAIEQETGLVAISIN
jgi:hypothetical protein